MNEEKILLNKLKEILPGYTGPARGLGRISQFQLIPESKKEKFMLYENKLKLFRNRLSAKKARQKNKLYLENLEDKVKMFEKRIKFQEEEIRSLRKKLSSLKEKKKKEKTFEFSKSSFIDTPPFSTSPVFDFEEIEQPLDLEIIKFNYL